jgi:hypothetical protein
MHSSKIMESSFAEDCHFIAKSNHEIWARIDKEGARTWQNYRKTALIKPKLPL